MGSAEREEKVERDGKRKHKEIGGGERKERLEREKSKESGDEGDWG